MSIAGREVVDLWSELIITDNGFGNYAKPILCCFVEGTEELYKEAGQ